MGGLAMQAARGTAATVELAAKITAWPKVTAVDYAMAVVGVIQQHELLGCS